VWAIRVEITCAETAGMAAATFEFCLIVAELVWANRNDDFSCGLAGTAADMLEAGLMVVVVVGADTAGVTPNVVTVDDVVGDGMTTPDCGNETTPNDEVRVGPSGSLWGTNMIPKIPEITKTRETAHQSIWVGRFSFCDFTSPNLV
jgi:hypothetical protein